MKKIILALTAVAGFACINPVEAQTDKQKIKDKDGDQQIIIMRKGDKDTKLTIETKDGEVFINGKPVTEYKDDNIIVTQGKSWKLSDKDHKFNLAPLHGYRDLFDTSFGGSRAFLGVTTEKDEKLVKVTDVTNGSAADKAGLKEGDVITKIGDKVINTPEELANAVSAYKPKDEVRITYSRDGKTNETKATLGERSWSRSFSFDGAGDAFQKLERLKDFKGLNDMQTFGLPDENGIYKFNFNPGRARLGIKIQDTEDDNGVKVVDVESGSAAEKAGIKKDDIITEISGKKVTNTDDARTELADNKDKKSYTVKAKRNGSEMSFEVKPVKKLKTTNL